MEGHPLEQAAQERSVDRIVYIESVLRSVADKCAHIIIVQISVITRLIFDVFHSSQHCTQFKYTLMT